MSALDNKTEDTVFKAIEKIAGIKTLIIIAHRLTTVKNCDEMFIIKDGRVVQHGKYEELNIVDVLSEGRVKDLVEKGLISAP